MSERPDVGVEERQLVAALIEPDVVAPRVHQAHREHQRLPAFTVHLNRDLEEVDLGRVSAPPLPEVLPYQRDPDIEALHAQLTAEHEHTPGPAAGACRKAGCGATVVIPPTRTATVSGRRPRSPARDRTIRQVQQAGRRQWKKDSGYHQQARMENAFFRYKLIIGESLRARSRAGQETEAILACNILNQMTQLGRLASYAIGR